MSSVYMFPQSRLCLFPLHLVFVFLASLGLSLLVTYVFRLPYMFPCFSPCVSVCHYASMYAFHCFSDKLVCSCQCLRVCILLFYFDIHLFCVQCVQFFFPCLVISNAFLVFSHVFPLPSSLFSVHIVSVFLSPLLDSWIVLLHVVKG